MGQFFPGDTIVHRLDPRVKIITAVYFIVVLFIIKGFWAYALTAAAVMTVVAISGIKIKFIVKGLKPLLIVLIFTAVLNALYTPGEILWQWWILKVTKEGLIVAAYMIVRIMLLIMGTSLLTYTTSPMKLTDAIEKLLSPLDKIHVPVHEFAMMMTIALRFIPTLIEETDKIMNAQKARGADFSSGGIMKRARALVPILIPLFISAFRRADDLATAMECRLYKGGGKRTRLYELSMTKEDYAVAAISVIVLTGILIVGMKVL